MGGLIGLTWAEYLDTPDEILRDSYCAEFDDDHNLVTLAERRRRLRDDGGLSGSPERAGRELPSRDELRIPPEAWDINPQLALTPTGQAFALMTWSVWRKRQREGVRTETGEPITDGYIMQRWAALAAEKG